MADPIANRMRTFTPLFFLLAAAAPAPTVPVCRDFGDWMVSCDNTRTCEARGFSQSGATADLRLLRAAGNASPSLVLSAGASVPLDGAAIRLDGASLSLRPPAWIRQPASPGHPATLAAANPAALRAFLGTAHDGHVLQLGAGDVGVPLDGLTAALLFMDAVQGRPGTTDPLVAAPGSGHPLPPLPLPRAPAWAVPPALTAGERHALLPRAEALRSSGPESCDATERPRTYPLDSANALVLRPCEDFAYQDNALVYILPRRGPGAAKPVVLSLPGFPGKNAAPQGPAMMGASFDSATGRLSTAIKGRGPNDCGLTAAWVWHAKAFHLTSLTFQDGCGGAQPGDFPTLYRSAGD